MKHDDTRYWRQIEENKHKTAALVVPEPKGSQELAQALEYVRNLDKTRLSSINVKWTGSSIEVQVYYKP